MGDLPIERDKVRTADETQTLSTAVKSGAFTLCVASLCSVQQRKKERKEERYLIEGIELGETENSIESNKVA